MKPTTSDKPLVTLTVRVSRETADRLKDVADAHYRPVAAELRRLIEDHVEPAADPDSKAAA